MSNSQSGFTHVLVTRPQADAERLAAMLTAAGIETIIQPAQDFRLRSLPDSELDNLAAMSPPFLLIFASPRAVEFGLPQLPASVTAGARYAAIGPATAHALKAAGRPVSVQSEKGYTSEALLAELAAETDREGASALVICAPGGRDVLVARLQESGWNAQPLCVYERVAVEISKTTLDAIKNAGRLLTVFTSGEAMNSMSKRLPPAAWYSVCRGDWLVISERLQRLARAFGPNEVHLAKGPGNADLVSAIRFLY